MTIVRVCHNRSNPYVQLNRKALQDHNISLEVRGLWAFCMSRPDDWSFNVKEMAKTCGVGRDKMLRLIKELIEAGYAIRLEFRHLSGKSNAKGISNEYVFFEFPPSQEDRLRLEEDFKKSFRQSCFQVPEDGNPENKALLNRYRTTKEREEEEGGKPPAPPSSLDFSSKNSPQKKKPIASSAPAPAAKKIYASKEAGLAHCALSDDEYQKLGEKFGEKGRAEWIDAINEQAEMVGAEIFNKGGGSGRPPHKSHYATILNWSRRAKKDHGFQSKPREETKKPLLQDLTERLKGRYTYREEFGSITFFTGNGYADGTFSNKDESAIEKWLKDKNL